MVTGKGIGSWTNEIDTKSGKMVRTSSYGIPLRIVPSIGIMILISSKKLAKGYGDLKGIVHLQYNGRKIMRQRWSYTDSMGTEREGFFEKFLDHGGTDVTYFFRRDGGRLDLVSGSRLKSARNITREYMERGLGHVGKS